MTAMKPIKDELESDIIDDIVDDIVRAIRLKRFVDKSIVLVSYTYERKSESEIGKWRFTLKTRQPSIETTGQDVTALRHKYKGEPRVDFNYELMNYSLYEL